MPERELRRMVWPRPVPTLWWVGDYTDIRERIRRCGRLDTDEIWLPASDDSYAAFCREHGSTLFDFDWREWNEADRAKRAHGREASIEYARRANERTAEAARKQQEQWEAEQRERQQAKQAASDREWQQAEAARQQQKRVANNQDREAARAWWAERNPGYAAQAFLQVRPGRSCEVDGIQFYAGQSYWMPWAVMLIIVNGW